MVVDLSGQFVDFHQGDAGSSIFAANNSSGIAQRPDADDRWLSCIGRSQTTGLNFRYLRALLPIVVSSNGIAIGVKESEHGVHQHPVDTELTQSRSQRAHNDPV